MYVLWQEIKENDFLLTMNFILFTSEGYSFIIVLLICYTATEALFPLLIAVLEDFCRIPFSSSVTLFWTLSKVQKWRPFKWFLSQGNKIKSQGLRSGE